MSNILTSENSSIIDDIMFCQPKKIQGGSYISSCYLTNENNNYPVYIQTPPFLFNGIKTKQNHAIIEIEENESNKKLFNLVDKLEKNSLPIICKNSSSWFRTEISLEYLEQSFEKQIKTINNKRVLQLKFPFKNNEITLDIVNTNNEEIKFNDIENKKIMGIFRYEGIKFLKNKSYLDFVLLKIQLQKENLTDLILPSNNEIKIENIENISFSKYDDDNDDTKTIIDEEINLNKDVEENINSSNLEEVNMYENNDNNIINESQNDIDSKNIEEISNLSDINNINNDISLSNENEEEINKEINIISSNNLDIEEIEEIDEINLDNLNNLDKVDIERYESYDYNSQSNDSEYEDNSDLTSDTSKNKELNISKTIDQDEILISNLELSISNLENDCNNSKNIYEQKLSNLRAERLKLNKLKGKKKKDSENEIIVQ